MSKAPQLSDGATASFHVSLVNMLDLFEHVEVHYHNSLPSDIERFYNQTGDEAEAGGGGGGAGRVARNRRQLGWWKRLKHHVDDDLHKIGHDIKKTADDVVGDANLDTTKTLKSFSWHPPSSVKVGPVSAASSYASISAGVHVSLSAHHYKLESAEVSAVLTADMKARAAVTLSSHHVTQTYTKTLIPSDTLGSINFAIGPIPVHISATIAMDLKASLTAAETIDIDTWARGTRSATFGVQYTEAAGWTEVKSPGSPSFSHEPPTFHASGSAEAKLWLDPSLAINVDCIGGPTVSAMPYLDLRFTAGESVSVTGDLTNNNGGCEGIYGKLGWGLGVDVSAKLALHLPGLLSKLDKTFAHWGPKAVYTMPEKTLYDKCISV